MASFGPRQFEAMGREPLAGMLSTLTGNGRLGPKLRELVIMRIGWVTGAEYEPLGPPMVSAAPENQRPSRPANADSITLNHD